MCVCVWVRVAGVVRNSRNVKKYIWLEARKNIPELRVVPGQGFLQ